MATFSITGISNEKNIFTTFDIPKERIEIIDSKSYKNRFNQAFKEYKREKHFLKSN